MCGRFMHHLGVTSVTGSGLAGTIKPLRDGYDGQGA